ncbi:hypothetical protein [Spirosoma arcticum]
MSTYENPITLTRLLVFHAIVTFAAGVVLIVAPGVIPGFMGIQVDHPANLLGAAEVGLAVLSYCSRKLSDRQALQVVYLTFIVFHSLTALLEVYTLTQGGSTKIWGNVALRIVVTGLFIYYEGQIRPTQSP